MGFDDYVRLLQASPGRRACCCATCRDAYKGLVQIVPEDDKTDELIDLTEWLGELVRQVDSSLLDEWDRLRSPDDLELLVAVPERPPLDDQPPPITANRRAFRVMVRNACFRRVELVATRNWTTLGELDGEAGWAYETWRDALEPYFAEHPTLGTGSEARAEALFQVTERPDGWTVRQVIDDPDAFHEWAIVLAVDLARSDEEGVAVVTPVAVERL